MNSRGLKYQPRVIKNRNPSSTLEKKVLGSSVILKNRRSIGEAKTEE
jgi:hypothetical protein